MAGVPGRRLSPVGSPPIVCRAVLGNPPIVSEPHGGPQPRLTPTRINTSMRLKLETLYDSVWQLFGSQHAEVVADRDDYRAKMKKRLGQDALKIQRHVDAALGRIQIDVNPAVMSRREFFELLALEKTVQEVKDQIDANAVFLDTDGLVSTNDVVPLLDDHGSMPVQNVKKFLTMVKTAEDETEGKRRLIEFLERAVKAGEAIRCDL